MYNFGETLWLELKEIGNDEDIALAFLYETLIDEHDNPENCNSFIKHCVGKKLSSDMIVHIYNALSVIKSELVDWEEFNIYAIGILKSNVDVKTLKYLLNAIDKF